MSDTAILITIFSLLVCLMAGFIQQVVYMRRRQSRGGAEHKNALQLLLLNIQKCKEKEAVLGNAETVRQLQELYVLQREILFLCREASEIAASLDRKSANQLADEAGTYLRMSLKTGRCLLKKDGKIVHLFE